jgi:hypothetical protein
MAFIEIFNFKKYFAKASDSQVARYGHVNALASRITSPVAYTQETSTGTTVEINSYCGTITLAGPIPSNTNILFRVNCPLVTETSVILLTVQYGDIADYQDDVSYGIPILADGLFWISAKCLTASSSTGTPTKFHYLIIN